jgi:hypothetical protein
MYPLVRLEFEPKSGVISGEFIIFRGPGVRATRIYLLLFHFVVCVLFFDGFDIIMLYFAEKSRVFLLLYFERNHTIKYMAHVLSPKKTLF